MSDEAVGMRSETVAPEAFIDDQYLAPSATKLHRGRQSGITPANDDDVVNGVAHKLSPVSCNNISTVIVASQYS
ncbi:hypothetical protein AGR1B_pa0244 [Agrobacterium fabacearum S56]|nr:hypothetical protein AGR1B_pa0244 [Agrobacterium fabacearum S56]